MWLLLVCTKTLDSDLSDVKMMKSLEFLWNPVHFYMQRPSSNAKTKNREVLENQIVCKYCFHHLYMKNGKYSLERIISSVIQVYIHSTLSLAEYLPLT